MKLNVFSEKLKYRKYNDVRYFAGFYDEVLRDLIPPKRRFDPIEKLDFDQNLHLRKKFIAKYSYKNHQIKDVVKNSKIDVHRYIKYCLDVILQFENERNIIRNIQIDYKNPYYFLKSMLLDFYENQCIHILYSIKDLNGNEHLFNYTDYNSNRIFSSDSAKKWFIETLEDKFEINNGKYRGIGAFVKAIIENEESKKFIFNESTKQKDIIEFINSYYGKELIKNNSNLGDPKNYINEVNSLIKRYNYVTDEGYERKIK